MKKCISVGNLSKNYLFIIAIVITFNIHALITGLTYHTYYIKFLVVENHIGHTYIHKLLYYLLILISSFIFYLYKKKRKSKNSLKIENNNQNYNDIDDINKNLYKNKNKSEFSNIPNYFVYIIMF